MYFTDKTILVTGGTGSMGKILVRRILSGELGDPKKVIILSRDEGKQHHMKMEYLSQKYASDDVLYNNFINKLEFRIGDVRSYSDVCRAIKNADIVINAAALKQVPVCEYFPYQAIQTNCLGVNNIVRAISENQYPVDTVMGISTDKACQPVNVMGMTKAIQERILISANTLAPKTRFICVRYGNVLASRGSVIPLFIHQIQNGGPITFTLPHMTRFLLSLNDAVDTVFSALLHAYAGETFIPIAPSATVENIAKALVGDLDIETVVKGIRPGEKIHESLISDEEANHCVKRGNYYVIRPMLPELITDNIHYDAALQGAYCSADHVISADDTAALLARHGLLAFDHKFAPEAELLR